MLALEGIEAPMQPARADFRNAVFLADGTELCNLRDLAHFMLRHLLDVRPALRQATGTEDHFTADFDAQILRHPRTKEQQKIYVKSATTASRIWGVSHINLRGVARVEVNDMPLTHGELSCNAFAFGRSTFGDLPLLVVLTTGSSGSGKATLRFGP